MLAVSRWANMQQYQAVSQPPDLEALEREDRMFVDKNTVQELHGVEEDATSAAAAAITSATARELGGEDAGESRDSAARVQRRSQQVAGTGEKAARLRGSPAASSQPVLNYDAHIFYYSWYGTPSVDGSYIHWNHRVLDDSGRTLDPEKGEIGANYLPLGGLYSSADPVVVDRHMRDIRNMGIGVLVLTWWGRDAADEQGVPGQSDSVSSLIMDTAAMYELAVIFHIEPYKGRDALSVREDIMYLTDTYGDHPAFYRDGRRGNLPVFYIYDSYLTPSNQWERVLKATGSRTLRGDPKYNSVVIGLYVNAGDERKLASAGFDGFYTYFAADRFTYGSTISNWKAIAAAAAQYSLLFIPCFGPGYVDTKVRPWNGATTRSRASGEYYDRAFSTALEVRAPILGITSYNEWHEGTQLEPAARLEEVAQDPLAQGYTEEFAEQIRKGTFGYQDYGPLVPDAYLVQTTRWVAEHAHALAGGRSTSSSG